MGKLSSFVFVTLDGYYAGPGGDIRWHQHGAEEGEYAAESLRAGNTLLFGRVTYQMMASYWPTPRAREQSPVVADGMNNLPKIVFSRTLKQASWSHTRLVKEGLAAELRKLKQEGGRDLVIMGSGTIVSQLTEERLIDEYMLVVNPIVLGKGRTIFEGVKERRNLKLTRTRAFRNGNVLLCYDLAA